MPPFAVAVIANAPLFTNRWEKDIQLGPSRQQNRLRQLLAGTRTRRTVECLNPRSWPWVCQASSLRDSHIGTSNRPLLSSKPPTPSCHLLSPPNVVPETVPSAAVERSFEQNSNALSHSEPFLQNSSTCLRKYTQSKATKGQCGERHGWSWRAHSWAYESAVLSCVLSPETQGLM